MLIYSGFRLLFIGLNYTAFQSFSAGQLFQSFFVGLRFDLAALAIINAAALLFFHLPKINFSAKVHFWTYILLNLPFFLLSVADTEYFKFIGRRTTSTILGIATDAGQQALNLTYKFWHVPFLWLIFSIVYIYFLKNWVLAKAYSKPTIKAQLLGLFMGLALSILAIRGGLQTKPLRPAHAFVQGNQMLGNLVLNSPFTFIKSFSGVQAGSRKYFLPDSSLYRYVRKQHTAPLMVLPQKQNVVLIIVESLNKEYLGTVAKGTGYTPFLDSLAAIGTSMQYHYANGRESIDAVPAILASIPRWMDAPYITSSFQANKLVALPHILNNEGYETSFYHGARNGSMGFDVFCQLAGIQQYKGLNEYPYQADFDGHWGIFDEPYLQYFAKEISQKKAPFFATVFTLSSHVPYTIPAVYKSRFPKGKMPFHEALAYTDYALKKFFEQVQKLPSFQNTLFVITGDHTHFSEKPTTQSTIEKYHVPLIFFHGNIETNAAINKIISEDKICQHADIQPSILHFLGIVPKKPIPFGQSIFMDTCDGLALNYSQGLSWMLTQNTLVEENDGEFSAKSNTMWKGTNSFQKIDCKKRDSIERHKALMQYYHNGLLDNNWF